MKIGSYIFSVTAGLFFLSAGTDKIRLTEGCRPGNLAPAIRSAGADTDVTFRDSPGYYTLLHFWAAYDAASRMQNVQLWNKAGHDASLPVKLISVSVDKPASVFAETVKADKLEKTNQLHEKLGEHSVTYKKYGLKNGLRNFLIDDNGVIVATNVTCDMLPEIVGKTEKLKKQ
jgi:hypothetical protein